MSGFRHPGTIFSFIIITMPQLPRLLHRRRVWQTLLLLALDGLLFGTTNVQKVPSLLIIVGFCLLVASIYYLSYALLGLARFYGLRLQHRRRFAGVLTGFAASLLALQSIGELSPRDVIVLLPLVALAYAYLSFAQTRPSS